MVKKVMGKEILEQHGVASYQNVLAMKCLCCRSKEKRAELRRRAEFYAAIEDEVDENLDIVKLIQLLIQVKLFLHTVYDENVKKSVPVAYYNIRKEEMLRKKELEAADIANRKRL